MTHYCFSTKWSVLPHLNGMNSVIVPYPFEALAWYRHWGLKRMHFRTYWAQFLLLTALNQAQTRAQYRHMQVKWCCKPISSRREKALLDPFFPSMRIFKPESCAAGDLLLFGTPRVSQHETSGLIINLNHLRIWPGDCPIHVHMILFSSSDAQSLQAKIPSSRDCSQCLRHLRPGHKALTLDCWVKAKQQRLITDN